jgi:hypothetical protein
MSLNITENIYRGFTFMCLPSYPFEAIILDIILIPVAILGIIFGLKYRKNKTPKNLLIFIVFFAICFGGFTYMLYSSWNYYYQSNYELLEYSLECHSFSDNAEGICLPISENQFLQQSLRITSGSGTFEIVETIYGTALLINFTGTIQITGTLNTLYDLNNYSLTLLNESHYNESIFGYNVNYWMFFQPTDPFDYNCSFKLVLSHETYNSWYRERCEGSLDLGWKTYPGTYVEFWAFC